MTPATHVVVYDAMSGTELAFAYEAGRASVTVPSLRIHSAVVFEGA